MLAQFESILQMRQEVELISKDVEICREIGQILYEAAPDGAKKIAMKASLVPEGDVCTFEYDYVNSDGKNDWFLPSDGLVDQNLRKLLFIHREFFVSQNQPPWKVFLFSMDVDSGKFSLELSYDD